MRRFVVLSIVLVLLGSCASSVDATQYPQVFEPPGGFFWGFWSGCTCGIAWFFSLFDSSIGIYEINNNGGWYNFGFILGSGSFVQFVEVIYILIFKR